MTVTYFFKGKQFEILISGKQWELAQTGELILNTWRLSNILVL